ncbi:MAG TPA: acetyl-CoA hydrolase/transferase C-terminal domain-containing protein [Thermoleophilaceae bacterium]|jgi:acyl-CoA hydrolase|nr:acetyl-CoA hydrolase/transferase C-terminal domain-containing protein [Thermoleophilaceae bacterium]
MSGPLIVSEGQLELARWISPGDGVVFGQACAEPTVLVDALLAQAAEIGRLRAFAGLTWGDRIPTKAPPSLRVVSYGALGTLGRLADLEIVPCHFSALPQLFAARALPGDVALIQVAPPDSRGRCSLGVGADYIADAAVHARVVIAEVNDHCPATAGAWIDWDRLDAAVMTSRPLLEAPVVEPVETERAIAAHVAPLVRDGDTIQIGVGALPAAIMDELTGHRNLGVHSGMITDGVLDLLQAGAVTNRYKPADTGLTVTGAALGSRRLFDALGEREDVVFAPVSYTHARQTLADVGRLCAINSAVEIDLHGQVNSESVGGRVFGAVGGQVDFLRAASACGGAAIVALPARRIVAELSGPVSSSRSDVDWVVTEHGARSLRGLTDGARAEALLELAGVGNADQLADVGATANG